jgi:hypothetical protein
MQCIEMKAIMYPNPDDLDAIRRRLDAIEAQVQCLRLAVISFAVTLITALAVYYLITQY